MDQNSHLSCVKINEIHGIHLQVDLMQQLAFFKLMFK